VYLSIPLANRRLEQYFSPPWGSIKGYETVLREAAKSRRRAQLKREASIALREALKREPTAAEIRYLSLGEAALGDKTMARIQAANALKRLGILLESRRELLKEMRTKRRRMRKLRAKSRAQASRRKKR
jgi:hypothetical protein